MAEAELVALETTTSEVEWLRELLMDLPLLEKPGTTHPNVLR